MQALYLLNVETARFNGQSAFLLSLNACSKVHSVPTDVYLNDNGLDGRENNRRICGTASSKDEFIGSS